MKLGKRQLMLATLVVALGAAVYLSWMLSDGDSLKITETLSSSSGYGDVELVNTGGEDDQVQETMGSEISSSEGEEEVSQTEEDGEAAQTMAQARLSRQQARDSASELLNQVLEGQDATDEEVNEATGKAAEIAENIIQESNIETLIKAKGYEDCIAIIEGDQCSVMVKIQMAQPNDAVIIKDIVHTQTGIEYDAIKIIEVN